MAKVQTPRRRRSRRGEGERLREEILDAAQRLLLERGSEEAVSIRAIADAVGITPPSIYLHFPDKEELFVAVCDARFADLDARSEAAARGATDPIDEIRRRGEAYVRFGLDHPEQYRILFIDPQARSVTSAQTEKWACLQHMVQAVQRGMHEGLVLDGDPFLVTLGLWSAVHGLVSLLISRPDLPWPPVDAVIDQVLGAAAFGIVPR